MRISLERSWLRNVDFSAILQRNEIARTRLTDSRLSDDVRQALVEIADELRVLIEITKDLVRARGGGGGIP